MHGWLAAGNLDIACLGDFCDMGECKQFNHLLNKFPEDQIFMEDAEKVSFLNGYVFNKKDYMTQTSKNWSEAFSIALEKDIAGSLKKLRGGFCGYIFHKQQDNVIAYVDQTAVKALYYYVNGNRWILSDRLDYMATVLKANRLLFDFNPLAARYMLTYGYMIDDSTFIKQIHRLLPGNYVSIKRGKATIVRYHLIENVELQMTEEEAVEKIDASFREAIRREFEKDKEYGYRHLVDLSGGLDSRMVSWVAHDMGYTDQVNMTYSQMDYYDETIAKQLADYLHHEYLFKALDDASWLRDVEKIVSQNNGAALYTGITGGSRMLGLLNTKEFGIEHTGMLGDVVLAPFFHDEEFSHGKPQFGFKMYSERLKYKFDDALLKEFPCQEIFTTYTRGILGAQSSYIIRQNYIETASPFMDVDFLDVEYSIPFKYRNRHHIYLKWMLEKYPDATEFGWEKWGGIKPKESHIFFRKIKTTQRLVRGAFCKTFKIANKDLMTPVDYWYQRDTETQKFYKEYFENNIQSQVITDDLREDIILMFREGIVFEKSMALTVLAMVKKYFA